MLENTVWRQFHNENNLKEILSELYGVDALEIINDDKELYSVLKAKLTKKELKLFAMESAKLSAETIQKECNYSDEELATAKNKLYKKMKQHKVRYAFRASSQDS